MKYVHVIPPEGWSGERHEEQFPDEMAEYEIYILVGMRSIRYGVLKKGDEVKRYLDHPGTVVTFGTVENKKFTPTKEINKDDIKEAMKEVVQ